MTTALDAFDAFVAAGDPEETEEAQDAWFSTLAVLADALAVEVRTLRELLRRHVMDFGPEGGCTDMTCGCSHQQAKRYLAETER